MLDEFYIPHTDEEDLLDNLHQSFMYAVFTTRLQTPKGKALVRHYEESYDARSVWVDLIAHYQSSTGAILEARNLMTFLSTFRLGEGSKWRQPTYNFVIYFEEKVELYNSMTRDEKQRSDTSTSAIVPSLTPWSCCRSLY